MGFFDTRTRALFCVDSFGALLPRPAETAGAIAAGDLQRGIADWSAIDAPWLAMADRAALSCALQDVVQLDPALLVSAHLPVATGMTATLARLVAGLHCAVPATAPDRA